MFIAFLPAAEAHAVLEEAHEADMARGEIEAELGSGFFMDCRDSYQASYMAREHTRQMQEDFDQSEDAPLYYARLEAARFVTEAITQDMIVHSEEEISDSRLFLPRDPVVVPEFYPHGGRPAISLPADPFGTFTPSDDDIPF